MMPGVLLNASLPPVVKSLQEGWSSAIQSSATVSALFAGISSQLFSFFTDTGNYSAPPGPGYTFMVILSYATMLLNAGASISSFLLIDSLSELPFRNATLDDPPYSDKARVFASSEYLLRKYGLGMKWRFALWHWLFCYFTGMWCLVLQIATYVLLQESDAVRTPICIIAIIVVLPFFLYLFPGKRM